MYEYKAWKSGAIEVGKSVYHINDDSESKPMRVEESNDQKTRVSVKKRDSPNYENLWYTNNQLKVLTKI